MMDFTPEEIRRLETRWKSDVDLKLDRLVRFADKYEGYLEALTAREKRREEFYDRLKEHVVKWGVIGVLAFLVGSVIMSVKSALKVVL